MKNRWLQLTLGIICMVTIANLQYGWTLFVLPIQHAHALWAKQDIQWAFTIFVVFETWLLPIEGYVIDRIGPRLTVVAGGVMIGLSWVACSLADTLLQLYAAMALGGVGAGLIYGATVGSAIRWFPDRRGLAAGLTAAGFGAGSAITVVPISHMIESSGYQHTFLFFGTLQGALVVLVSLLLCKPPGVGGEHNVAVSAGGMMALLPSRLHEVTHDYTPGEVARTFVFWLMYAIFFMVAVGGQMATAQLAVIAADFGVAKTPVTLLFLTLPALTFALAIDRVLNGLTRPFFGWVSDQIGRENTMFIAFLLEGVGIYTLTRFANDPVAFVVLTGLVFFAFGEIYSLFPATSGDTFGRKFAATNYGLLYTAKGTATLLVPFGNTLRDYTGSWLSVLYIAAALNILAALLALFVLKPLRRRFLRRSMEQRALERLAEARFVNHGAASIEQALD